MFKSSVVFRKKMRSIPFVGAEVSQSIYRTTDWISRNPVKTAGMVAIGGALSLVYDAKFTHNDRVASNIVGNPLEYDTYSTTEEDERRRIMGTDGTNTSTSSDAYAEANAPLSEKMRSLTNIAMEKEIEKQTDPFLKAQMQAAYEIELEKTARAKHSAMVVTSSQLDAREPHWNLRMNEKNWSIMARDMQKQKDSYVYRVERSRDDDFGRNAPTASS